MTTPLRDAAPADAPRVESFLDWFHINSRLVYAGATVVALVGFGAWFVQRKALNETLSADRKLSVAKQSLNSGNAALAEADLRKVASQYASKPAGREAGLLLAQMRMDKGDFAGAVTELRGLAGRADAGPGAAQLHGLLGDALMQSSKAVEAAAEYEKAATLALGPAERSYFQTKAGRAYVTADRVPEARRVFEALASQSENDAAAAEARVRLGELTAGSAPLSR